MDKRVGTADFITRLADKGYTKKDSAVIIADVLDVFYDAIRKGETVSLIGFGSLRLIKIKDKDLVSIHTGKRETVPAHNIVKFSPGITLRECAAQAELVE